jgi:hypothetical protein
LQPVSFHSISVHMCVILYESKNLIWKHCTLKKVDPVALGIPMYFDIIKVRPES